MKKYINKGFAFIILLSLGCNYRNDNRSNIGNIQDSSNIILNNADTIASKDKSCSQSIREFLSWYRTNLKAIDSIQFFSLSGSDSSAFYRVNFQSVEKYIAKLRTSGYFSEKYLNNRSRNFRDTDNSLLKSKQSDGVVEGFDYDPFLFTQEPEAVLERLDSLQIKEITPENIMLISLENNLLFKMEKKEGKCLIDEISFRKKTN